MPAEPQALRTGCATLMQALAKRQGGYQLAAPINGLTITAQSWDGIIAITVNHRAPLAVADLELIAGAIGLAAPQLAAYSQSRRLHGLHRQNLRRRVSQSGYEAQAANSRVFSVMIDA